MIEMIEMPENSNKEKKGQMVLLKDVTLTFFFLFGPPKKNISTATKNQKHFSNCPAAPAWIFTYICLQVVLIVCISTNLGWNERLPSVVSVAISCQTGQPHQTQTEMPKKRCSVPTASHAHGARDSPPE